jgi:hypothetical protein
MTRILKSYLVVFGLQTLLFSDATILFAQVDPTKVLVGTWEGQVESGRNLERTLVISSVKPTGSGEWMARGRLSVSRQADTEKVGGQEIMVISKDNEIFLDFIGKTEAKLKLIGDDKLEGTMEVFDKRKVVPKRLKLEKVRAKEVK